MNAWISIVMVGCGYSESISVVSVGKEFRPIMSTGCKQIDSHAM